MIVVQTIRVSWTKKSRGGHLAELRAQVPTVFAVPDPADSRQLVWHDVKLSEEDQFSLPREGELKTQPLNERFGTRCAFIDEATCPASLTYRWTNGAPERMFTDPTGRYVPVEKRFLIKAGEWASVQYNGRFSGIDSGNWWYELETVNVGVMDPFNSHCFLDCPPAKIYQQLASLW